MPTPKKKTATKKAVTKKDTPKDEQPDLENLGADETGGEEITSEFAAPVSEDKPEEGLSAEEAEDLREQLSRLESVNAELQERLNSGDGNKTFQELQVAKEALEKCEEKLTKQDEQIQSLSSQLEQARMKVPTSPLNKRREKERNADQQQLRSLKRAGKAGQTRNIKPE